MRYRTRAPSAGERITPAAVDAFRAVDTLTLRRELAIRPWQACPLDTHDDDPPADCPPGPYRNSWQRARLLRELLEVEA